MTTSLIIFGAKSTAFGSRVEVVCNMREKEDHTPAFVLQSRGHTAYRDYIWVI